MLMMALVIVFIRSEQAEAFKLRCSFLGGESGVPLKLHIDIQDTKSPSLVPLYSAGCQIKVFKVGS